MSVHIFRFGPFMVNTYLLVDEPTKKAAIIDPGMIDQHERRVLHDFIERNGLQVTHIINTHMHIDHAVADMYAAKKYGAPVLAHKDDEPLAASLPQQAAMFGLAMAPETPEISVYLQDGDTVRIGDTSLKVLHVPGHSPGGIALYDAADGILFSGDSLFQGSIGRTDLPGGNGPQLVRAIKEKILTLPADTTVYPGHGDPTTIRSEARTNPFLV